MALPKGIYKQEGSKIVLRDENDRIVKDERGKPTYANLPQPAELRHLSKKQKKESWRNVLGKLTRKDGVDGAELLVNHLNLARGVPQIHTLPDGRTSEPVLITPEVQRAANSELMQMQFGKAVAMTEQSKIAEDEQKRAKFEAMSEAQLDALIEGEFAVLPEGEEPND